MGRCANHQIAATHAQSTHDTAAYIHEVEAEIVQTDAAWTDDGLTMPSAVSGRRKP